MKFLFVYQRGTVPQDKMQELGKEWFAWGQTIHEQTGFRIAEGKSVSEQVVEDYKGTLSGVSIIEADSLDEAINKAKGNPGLKYGGSVEVFSEWKV